MTLPECTSKVIFSIKFGLSFRQNYFVKNRQKDFVRRYPRLFPLIISKPSFLIFIAHFFPIFINKRNIFEIFFTPKLFLHFKNSIK